jgi:Rieske Fe-S protein
MTIREEPPALEERRTFLASIAAIGAAAVAALLPIGASARALLDPLRYRRSESRMVRVAALAALPASGRPVRVSVSATRLDGWTTHSDAPIGAVYLRRTPDGVKALNVVCPHAGCSVGLAPDGSRFACPCHKSAFDLDGRIADPRSPSPRDMDALDVEVREGGEIWVRFQQFMPGTSEQTPV